MFSYSVLFCYVKLAWLLFIFTVGFSGYSEVFYNTNTTDTNGKNYLLKVNVISYELTTWVIFSCAVSFETKYLKKML